LQAALARVDAANSQDPNTGAFEGKTYPRELLYGQRMTHWLAHLAPEASEPLQLAVRCQHLRRWEIPRDRYPMDRRGYHQWRTALYQFHAEKAGEILREVGYDETTIERVGQIIQKKNLSSDPETQWLEDAAGLVFLENYLADFSREHEEAKLIEILRKTWKKMSPRGREAAMQLDLEPQARALVERALGEEEGGE